MAEPVVRVRASVRGRVQGVGFRATTVEVAGRLGVRGEVSNRPDGSLECIAEGARPAVEALVEWLREGPPSARVERVDVVEESHGQPLPPMHAAGWG